MAKIWGREYVDFGLRCMVDNHRSRSTIRWCWSMVGGCRCRCLVRRRCMVSWSWGMVSRCSGVDMCRSMVGRFNFDYRSMVDWLCRGMVDRGGAVVGGSI